MKDQELKMLAGRVINTAIYTLGKVDKGSISEVSDSGIIKIPADISVNRLKAAALRLYKDSVEPVVADN